MLQLEEVFIDNYLEKRIERETILNTYLESYNSLSKRIDRQRYTTLLGNRMIQCNKLVEHHDSVIKGYLFNLKEQIVSYFGVETGARADFEFRLEPINEAAFDENLEGQTDLFFAHLHLFITALKIGIAEGSYLKEVKKQYNSLKNYAGNNANSYEPSFDDLQLLISESTTCCNSYMRYRILQKLLSRISDINYGENLTYTPRSEVVRNHSIKVPTLIKDMAEETAQKKTSTHHAKTIEIYLNQYRKNPQQSRSVRIEECISIAEDEAIRTEFTDKCGDSTLLRWEKKLEKRLEELKRFSGLSS